jgi:hypothetical protein
MTQQEYDWFKFKSELTGKIAFHGELPSYFFGWAEHWNLDDSECKYIASWVDRQINLFMDCVKRRN